jgi:hypothetical protein
MKNLFLIFVLSFFIFSCENLKNGDSIEVLGIEV